MPRGFNQKEQAEIRATLRAAGLKLFSAHGVSKTSIDELTAGAGIAKGSFYKFYKSKELLYFELLEDAQERIRRPLLNTSGKTRATFEKRLRELFDAICQDPLIQIMGRKSEYIAIRQKTPPQVLSAHEIRDQEFLDDLIERWNIRPKSPKRDIVAARITLLMMLSLQKEFFGARLFPHAVDTAVSAISDCLFDEPLKTSHK